MEKKMKNSGIEWVGEIPDNWKIERMKSCIALREGGAWGEEETGDNDTVCLRVADFDYDRFVFKNTPISALTKRHYSKSTVAKLKLLKGDIVIEKSGGGDKTPVGRTVIFDKNYVALFANFMDRLRCCAFVYPKFMQYIFVTFYKNQYTRNYIKQTTGIQNLDLSLMLNKEHVPIPPLSEQKAIAGFLDKKCGEVDALIADIQQEIETLEQYKRSVITEAVTKGLDPSVPMKESGIDWLGMQPVQWEHYKGKYIFKQRNERGNKIELQLLSPTQNYGVIPQTMYEELSGMNAVKLNERTDLNFLKTIHKGDYCISLRSFQGGFEYSQYEGVVSPAYQVFYPTRAICEEYYKYLFKEKSFIAVMNSYTLSLRDGKNIAFSDFGNTMIPYPPIEEQQKIAEFLDKKCKEIEEIIADKQSQIETLESYKKSLIYEYVTGKKEVG